MEACSPFQHLLRIVTDDAACSLMMALSEIVVVNPQEVLTRLR